MTFQLIKGTALATILAILGILLMMPSGVMAQQKELKIGVIDFQAVIMESSAGKRMQRILEITKNQKEKEFKTASDQLEKDTVELRNNILLTPEARQQKEQELEARRNQLRIELRDAELELQRANVKATESIYGEIKSILAGFAGEQGFDFVLEKSLTQALLYSSIKTVDITAELVSRYDKIGESADSQ